MPDIRWNDDHHAPLAVPAQAGQPFPGELVTIRDQRAVPVDRA